MSKGQISEPIFAPIQVETIVFIKPRPNDRNMPTQHVATCWAQQCCDMLRWHVAIVWPGLYPSNLLRTRAVLKIGGYSLVTWHVTCLDQSRASEKI